MNGWFWRWGIRAGGVFGLWVLAMMSPTPAEEAGARADWPEFRGPTGDGHAGAGVTGIPLTWSETQNVAWKTALPMQGWSTPCVSGDQVWMTSATEDGHEFHVLCVDASTGQIRFDKILFRCDEPEPLGNNVNGYASPSPVVADGRVYVHFGSYGTACLDAKTADVIWKRADLPCRHYRGPGSSPYLYDNLLYLTFDGIDQQYVAALDAATGGTVWRTDRSTVWDDLDEQGLPKRGGDLRKGFTTPIVVPADGGPQLISPGSTTAFAYEPRTGKEIWSARIGGHSPAPRPVYGNGVVYVDNGRGKPALLAIRVDGRGDVTDTHVAWKFEGSELPQEPSMLLVDGLLYMVSNSGMGTCLDAGTGAVVWSERLGGNYVASPIYADGRLYFFSTQGKAVVLKPGRTYEVLATNELESGLMASPAVAGRALYLRTKTHLYRIEEK